MRIYRFIFSFLVLLFSGSFLFGQCPNDNLTNGFPNPFSPSGPGAGGAVTSTNSWGGDYLETTVTSGNVYTWTSCSTSPGFDPAFSLYQQPGGLLAFNDNFCGNLPEITWTATFSGTVRLLVDQMPGCVNNSSHVPVTLSFTSGCNALTVTSNPGNANVCPGDNASFSGGFTGDTPITFQWFFSSNGGATWNAFADGGTNPTVSGSQTGSLGLANVPSSFNGYRVRLEGTNPCGTVPTSSAIISTSDNTAPVITNPGNQNIYVNGSCQVSLPDFFSSLSIPVTDNCDPSPVTSQTPGAGTLVTGANTSLTVSLFARDASFNTATSTFSVTTLDTIGPSLSCQNITTHLDGSGSVTILPNDVFQSGSDNCGSVNLTGVTPNDFVCSQTGPQTVTLTANDGLGNTSSCTATVTVVDSTSPGISCPSNTTVANDAGQCSRVVTYLPPSGSDNCGTPAVTRTAGLGSGGTFPVGTTVETYRATDASGNFSECSFSIQVFDSEDPVFAPLANQTGFLDGSCIISLPDFTTIATLTDNCPSPLITQQSPAAGTTVSGHNNSLTISLLGRDAAFNSATSTFTFTAQDSTPPSVVCQNITKFLDNSGSASLTPADIFSGGTDNCGGVTPQSVSVNSFNCNSVGNQTVTLTAIDAAGNTGTCTANVLVRDTVAPVAVCNNATVYLDGSGDGTVTFAQLNNSSSDACGINSGFVSPASFTCLNVGSNSVTLTVEDNNSNVSTCTATVTVLDSIAPVISCPTNQSVNNTSGQCAATVTYTIPTASDNCNTPPVVSRTAGLASGSPFPIGNTTVSYQASDPGGNSANCSFIITVVDAESPNISCPANQSVGNTPGQCTATVNYSVPMGTDNCPGASTVLTSGLASGSAFPGGTNTVTYTVTDASGNTDSCSFTITVADNIAPSISCPANLSVNNDAGQCSAVVAYTAPGGTDNCPGATTSRTAGLGTGGTFPIGSTTETYTVTDASGNTDSCSFAVIVVDNESPSITCPANLSVGTDNGICAAMVTYGNPSAADNCPGVSFSLSSGLSSGSTFNAGTNVVTYTASDAAANIDSCFFTVTVVDDEAPAITCPANVSTNVNAGQCAANVSYSLPTATDNCGTPTVSLSSGGASGASFPVGNSSVTYLANDTEGNTDSCSFVVTVIDNENPNVTCPANISVSNDPGQCSATVTYTAPSGTDNCPGATTALSAGQGSGGTFVVGSSTETYTVTDAAGNTASCNFTVTVTDNESPSITCIPNITRNNDAGQCNAVVTYTAPAGTDNCPGAVTSLNAGLGSGSTFPLGSSTESYAVSDAAGNVDSCFFTVTVVDAEAPAISCPTNITQNNTNGQCVAVVSYTAPQGTDNCPGAATVRSSGLGSGSSFPVGTSFETYTVTDAAGNTDSCSFSITVVDNENPVILCPSNITQNNSSGQCSANISYATPVGTDNCPGANTSLLTGFASGASFPVGLTTVTYRVTDAAGNGVNCSFTVTVADNEDPTITCPSNLSVSNDPGQCAATVSYTAPAGADNCPGVTTALTVGQGSGGTFPVGITTETYTASDNAGNTAACSFTVTVTDGEAPNAVCQSTTVYLNSSGQGTLTANSVGGTSTDNCQVQSLGLSSTAFGCANLGNSTVTLTVTDNSNNTDTCVATITVADTLNPVANCQNLVLQLPASGDTTLTATVLNNNSTDNCSIDSLWLSQSRFTCQDIGTNTVMLMARDTEGNVGSCAASVTVNDNLGLTDRLVDLGADTTICGGGSLTLDGGAGFDSWAWSSGGNTQFETIFNSGIISVVSTDSLGCTGTDSIDLSLHVVADPNPRSNGGPAVLCLNDSLELIANGGYTTYIWSTGATTFNTTVSSGGTFMLTVTDSTNCQLNDSVEVLYFPFPAANPQIEPNSPISLCDSEDVFLDAKGGYFTYSWNTGATSQNITVNTPGDYTVTVTNGFGCWGVDTAVVNPSSIAAPSITQSGDTLFCSAVGVDYQWFRDGQAISLATQSFYVAMQSGSYQVVVTDIGGCEAKSDPWLVVGIEAPEAPAVRLYPNPTQGSVWLEAMGDLKEPVGVELFDMLGNRVMGWGFAHLSGKTELDLQGISDGVYLIRVVTDKGTLTQRLVIQR